MAFVACLLMVISPAAQLYETFKKKTVQGLSFLMLSSLFAGCALMGCYVLVTTSDVPLLLNYGFNVVVVGINIWFYYRYT